MDELTGDRKRQFKNAAYAATADIAAGFADARRLEICDLLTQRPWSAAELARESAAGLEAVEADLRALALSGLAEEGDPGRFRLRAGVAEVLVAFHRLAREDPRVQALLREHIPAEDALAPHDLSEMASRVASGRAVILDVRPAREHAEGSVPGAIAAPLESIGEIAARLPDDVEVITMCRGPFCCWAEVAASRLRERGIAARSVPAGAAEVRARLSG